MMRGYRNLLWLVPLLLAVTWPLWGERLGRFLVPAGSSGRPATVAAQGKSAGFVMEGVRFLQLKAGRKDWLIVTDRLAAAGDKAPLELRPVSAQVFQDDQVRFRIRSRQGSYDRRRRILTLRDQVRVVMAEGYEIQTSFLQYLDASREIVTSARVWIKGKDLSVRGKGLRYSLASGAYSIGGRVRTTTW